MMPSTSSSGQPVREGCEGGRRDAGGAFDQTMEQRTVWIWKPAEVATLQSLQSHVLEDMQQPAERGWCRTRSQIILLKNFAQALVFHLHHSE